MKNFDVERNERLARDRSFTIAGESFTYKASVAPEAIVSWSKMVGGEFVERDENGKTVLDGDGKPISSLSEENAIKIYDLTILGFLEAGQEDKWNRVRDPNAEHPISLSDLSALVRWLFEEQAARPTTQPSGSSNGPVTETTGTTLTDVSASPVAAA